MQRILDPAQIEAFAATSVPRIRLPDPASLFARRGQRLRTLAEGHSLGDYLRLMAAVADGQQVALDALRAALVAEQFAQQLGRQIELAHEHRMPLLQAAGWPRQERWRAILTELCTSIAGAPGFPAGVRSVCERIVASPGAGIETQADLLIAARTRGVDAQAAPFVMAALQVYWAAMASSLQMSDVTQIDVPGVCPTCGTLPVSSIVRSDKRSQGYRYLH
ncbi:MAG TPA: formate dehydrogenase accessory protein FdhE, partial [Steroidobacteraceae bacterium]|nr:formate dehydrogenase accessory protein FdhE [Steroidobacteraceae bacterium]